MPRHATGAMTLAGAGAAAVIAIGPSAYACPVPAPTLGSILRDSGCEVHCGPDDCGPAGAGPLSTGGASGRGGPVFPISIVGSTFVPVSPIIKPNTTVRWTNNDFLPHTSTRFGRWDSGFLDSGGTFDHPFAAADAGLAFDYTCIVHFGMDGTIRVARFGDANLDGIVNLADFNLLAGNFGQSGRTWETGDFTGDGLVNLADFNLLAANFGMGIEPALTTINLDFGSPVPEPMGLSMLMPLMVMMRRRRNQ